MERKGIKNRKRRKNKENMKKENLVSAMIRSFLSTEEVESPKDP